MTDNEIWNERSKLLLAYMQELATIDERIPCTAGAVYHELLGYRIECDKGYGEWHDIIADGKIAGFIIICKAPNCHPDADLFIEESYIAPEYRKRSLMTQAMKEQVAKHPVRYCMFILDDNTYAKNYWKKLFTGPKCGLSYEEFPLKCGLSYEEFPLRDIGACRPGISQYGFRPKKVN